MKPGHDLLTLAKRFKASGSSRPMAIRRAVYAQQGNNAFQTAKIGGPKGITFSDDLERAIFERQVQQAAAQLRGIRF